MARFFEDPLREGLRTDILEILLVIDFCLMIKAQKKCETGILSFQRASKQR